MGLMVIGAQPNSVSTTNTGISIRVTAAAAISAVAVNIAPPLALNHPRSKKKVWCGVGHGMRLPGI